MPYVNNQHFCGRPFELKLNGNADVPVAAGQGRHYADAIRTAVIDVAATITPAAATGGGVTGSVKLLDFPESRVVILGIAGSISFSSSLTDASFSSSLGTTAASTANNTLETTEVDIIASGDVNLATANTAVARVINVGTLATALDGVTTPVDIFLNIASDTVVHTSVTVTGKIAITWVCLGDTAD